MTGAPLDAWGAVVVINAENSPLKGCAVVASPAVGTADTLAVPEIPAMGVRKIAFKIRLQSQSAKGEIPVRLTLLAGKARGRTAVDTATVRVRIVTPQDPRRETFISGTDGSVQYYAVLPPLPGSSTGHPALFFSLHGAGVEALNQTA